MGNGLFGGSSPSKAAGKEMKTILFDEPEPCEFADPCHCVHDRGDFLAVEPDFKLENDLLRPL